MEQKTVKMRFKSSEMRAIRALSEKQLENMKGTAGWRRIDFVISLLIVVLLAFTLRTFVFEPVRVDGRSMVPTLQDNERMIVEKISYLFSKPQRGDIVICYYPGYKDSCVKRVIGMPGETVSVSDGKIYINGEALDESAYWGGYVNGSMAPVLVGEDEYFVIGDNRNNSKDSRYSTVGAIPIEKIKGRVCAIAWPFSNFRIVNHVDYSA